jgi:hypothetical protein
LQYDSKDTLKLKLRKRIRKYINVAQNKIYIMKTIISILIIFSLLIFSGCNSYTSESIEEQQKFAEILKKESKNIGGLSNIVKLPIMPEEKIAKSNISGIDSNNNKIRDELEIIIFQGLNTLPNITIESYNEVLTIIKMIQPREISYKNSINKQKNYCSYKLLPNNIKKELPLELLYSIILDTSERKKIFTSSLETSTFNLEEEPCE